MRVQLTFKSDDLPDGWHNMGQPTKIVHVDVDGKSEDVEGIKTAIRRHFNRRGWFED